ncbi:hypothetical protein [Streptomyces albidoflavus]|uniref:hypothetical protein n=1 Tax=Streptomyces albidoflavus TaxID=1886 RepID=UPI00101F3EDC|nr:hypothetical protein [Streptomyces albidoflavus]RZF02888.1 hypothetical protein C0R05_32265 [Streptomyces albidoflavus]
MNLSQLLAAATAGPVSLTDLAGQSTEVETIDVLRLYVAVADDCTTMGLGLLDVPTAEVTWESAQNATVRVASLRYAVCYGVERLCTAPGCLGPSTGTNLLTRVCAEHLDVLVPGVLPNAGDDIAPGDLELAAQQSRWLRLNVLQSEIDERARDAAGDRQVLERLRQG